MEKTIESFRRIKELTGLSTAQLAHETGITSRAAAALLSGKVEGFCFPDDLEKRIEVVKTLYHDFSTYADSGFSGRVVDDGPIIRPRRRDGSPMYSDPRIEAKSRDFSAKFDPARQVISNSHGKTHVFKYIDGVLVKVN
jgi:transcriptional regulator with XRE-family HTH domain